MRLDVRPMAKRYYQELKRVIDQCDLEGIQKIAERLHKAYENDRTIFIFGNGGSASTASHMAADFGKGTLKNVYNAREKRLRVISLTDNVASMTAFANDLSYDDMFSQQLHNLVQRGDVVIGISGSGNSPNVIKALMHAKQSGATTIGLLGFGSGGKAKAFCDHALVVPSNNYGIIEDFHASLGHVLTTMLSAMKDAASTPMKGPAKSKGASAERAHEWVERSQRR